MTLTTARHSDMGAGGSQSRYLTYVTSDPQMIEVAAFPALVLRLRDEVTSPLGALWLQGARQQKVGYTRRNTGAALCWERRRNLSAGFRPEDTLANGRRAADLERSELLSL